MDAHEVRSLAALEHTHWWYAARRSIVRRLSGVATPGARALDVGAAAGGNAAVLAANGWDVTVVDLSPEACEIARGRGLRAARADLTRLPVRDSSVDLVLAYDVLEHIEDDGRAAREIARVLRPGGRLLAAVPAGPDLWSAHDVAVGHQRRYTRPAFVTLLTAAGLAVEDVGYWNVVLRPVVRLRRRSASGSDLAPVARPVNAALRALVEAEWRVPALRRLRGVTLLAEARKGRS